MRGHSPLPHIGLLEIETGDGLHRILKARPALAVPHDHERIRVVRQRAELRLRRIELVLPAARWRSRPSPLINPAPSFLRLRPSCCWTTQKG